ncbi:MAG: hypothetical protein KDD55_11505 [Bdellovibrionales bacterium]|nr:hypothetical protein [Bdellovibrionales bacterium]
MSYSCHHCGTELTLSSRDTVGRREECPSCGSDLHVCLNCAHFDTTAYNECREPQAERVVDKDRSNFCDYFQLSEKNKRKESDEKEAALKKLDDLFS